MQTRTLTLTSIVHRCEARVGVGELPGVLRRSLEALGIALPYQGNSHNLYPYLDSLL